jgi:hypothetical protein
MPNSSGCAQGSHAQERHGCRLAWDNKLPTAANSHPTFLERVVLVTSMSVRTVPRSEAQCCPNRVETAMEHCFARSKFRPARGLPCRVVQLFIRQPRRSTSASVLARVARRHCGNLALVASASLWQGDKMRRCPAATNPAIWLTRPMKTAGEGQLPTVRVHLAHVPPGRGVPSRPIRRALRRKGRAPSSTSACRSSADLNGTPGDG